MKKQIALHIFWSMLIGIVIAVGVNEGTFLVLKSEAGRPPKSIELVIPAGTADQIAKGQPSPGIPTNMVFVVGDTLIVKNEDSVDHHLGPLFIPAGTSASLPLEQADNLAISCSFQSQQYFGLDVREPVTWATRLYGVLFSGVPLGILLALYSFLVWPMKPKEQALV